MPGRRTRTPCAGSGRPPAPHSSRAPTANMRPGRAVPATTFPCKDTHDVGQPVPTQSAAHVHCLCVVQGSDVPVLTTLANSVACDQRSKSAKHLGTVTSQALMPLRSVDSAIVGVCVTAAGRCANLEVHRFVPVCGQGRYTVEHELSPRGEDSNASSRGPVASGHLHSLHSSAHLSTVQQPFDALAHKTLV